MFVYGGAAIAQWIRPNLPSCCPGFESQAHHLRFHQFMLICVKKGENKQKESGIGPFLKKVLFTSKQGQLWTIFDRALQRGRPHRLERQLLHPEGQKGRL